MKIVFTLLGFLFMAIGAVGVVLPVLPTTPFMLLAAACFLRGSPRFRVWFQSTRLYQRHGKQLMESHAMTMKSKLKILIPVTVLLCVIFILASSTALRLLLIAAVILKWCYFFLKIKTIRPDDSGSTRLQEE